MDKKAIMAELKAGGIFDINSKHPLWIKAFDAYNTEGKVKPGFQKLSPNCGTCFTKVRNWMQA